jgi:hypothetical protein
VLVPWLALGGTVACHAAEGPRPASERHGAASDDAGSTSEIAPVERDAGAPFAATTPDDPPSTATSADSGVKKPSCVAEAGTDVPDDDFVDSNCDGIDGDAAAAVFVATTGSDAAAGTMSAPVRTLGKAIATARLTGKSVYVCNGEYDENVAIDGAAVSVYGGYDCTDSWRRVVDRAVVKPASGTPLTVTHVYAPVTFDRIAFRAPDATADGGSSIAAVVLDTLNAHFSNVELRAGNAKAGAIGAPATNPVWAPVNVGANGESVVDGSGCGAFGTQVVSGGSGCSDTPAGGTGFLGGCPDGGVSIGGHGGTGGNAGLGFAQTSGAAGVPAWTQSLDGTPGADGVNGTPGLASFGHLDHGRYVPADGNDATPGSIGYAGMGGSGGRSGSKGDVESYYPVAGGGGQGGYPGCGGAPGHAGGGGGASIALISEGSTIALDWCDVITNHGGDGGGASSGLTGQGGGAGGKGGLGGSSDANGQNGGRGGNGGKGGDGGPGAGGPSIGVVASGSMPTTSNVTFVLGAPGRGGASSDATAPGGMVVETLSLAPSADAGL